jgi:hypothetical protein
MKNRIAFVAGVLLLSFASADQARASSFYLESTFFPGYNATNPYSDTSNNIQQTPFGGSTSGLAQSAKTGFSIDARNTAGFKLWDRWLVGFTYDYSRTPVNVTASADNGSLNGVTKKTEYGPAIGYIGSNFRIVFTYFVGGSESYTETSTNADTTPASDLGITNHLRNGYQIVVGYAFNLSTSVQIGPSLVYRHAAYKSQDAYNNLDSSGNFPYSDRAFTTDSFNSNLTPMITLIVQLF